jgi:hypothetical protein
MMGCGVSSPGGVTPNEPRFDLDQQILYDVFLQKGIEQMGKWRVVAAFLATDNIISILEAIHGPQADLLAEDMDLLQAFVQVTTLCS